MPAKHRCNSGSDSDGSTPPRKRSGSKNGGVEDYRMKRDRNNIAVRKSREKSRQKAKETMQKVNLLKRENEDLEMKVKLLSKELNLLKDLFLGHATGGGFENQSAGVPFPIKTETVNSQMDSSGETDNSVDSFPDLYGEEEVVEMDHGAGTYVVNAEAVQKDHEYSVPLPVK